MNPLARYIHWLHTQWPAGHVEKLPITNDDGGTNVRGFYVAGDLRGVPLLKFAADSGARVVQTIARDSSFRPAPAAGGKTRDDPFDLLIVGEGVAGCAAALEARKRGFSFCVVEASERFSTIVNVPTGKPIYTYPKAMTPAGELTISADVKESLVEELRSQADEAGIVATIAHVERAVRRGNVFEVTLSEGGPAFARYIVAAPGRSGNFRRLEVPGEDMDKVYNRLHDPKDFCAQRALVVGGGDSALETAVALAQCGGNVTISYRKAEFSRPKAENIDMVTRLVADPGAEVAVENPSSERVTTASGDFMREHHERGSIRLMMKSRVKEVRESEVVVESESGDETIANDVVFTMIGREPPLDLFRRSGVSVHGDWSKGKLLGLAAFFAFCVLLYNWKSGGALGDLFYANNWFPISLKSTFAGALANPASLASVLVTSAATPSFWYTRAYSLLFTIWGGRRIRRRKTPYVTAQTWVLMSVQVLPLFILPEILLPYLGKNALLSEGLLNALFPVVDYGNGREYWRSYGLILAWPLNVYNVFTDSPLLWWLIIAFAQTFILIPLGIYFWGKGVYCGWVCSCGALAETLGDTHRAKMPHGPRSSRFNVFGQVVLLVAVVMLVLRVVGWLQPGQTAIDRMFPTTLNSYKWGVDVFLAGVVGYGVYFWFSGRVWCRFMCPLAALMHIFARFSRFRIIADKKKCISCNVCTSVCHQGIDVMNFANKGLHMKDPECVRCSACLQSCPTGVLAFGQVDGNDEVIKVDALAASPVRMREN